MFLGGLPAPLQQSLTDLEGLKRLADAITVLLIDYGGITPEDTCASIKETAPALYREFGFSRVLAVCEDVQYSEIPEQSAALVVVFERFNQKYFAGRLADTDLVNGDRDWNFA